MKSIHRTFTIVSFAVLGAYGCNSKLEVGAPDDLDGAAPSGGAEGSGGREGGTGGAAGAASSGGGDTGGSSGSGGSGTGGSDPEDWVAAATPTEPAFGSSHDCPVGPLYHASDCETPGQVCGYLYEPTQYQECACRRTATKVAWTCEGAVGDFQTCPDEVPEVDADCFGHIGVICFYPPAREVHCGDSAVWESPNPEPAELPSEPPEPPSPSTPVSELTDEERQAWCEWYSFVAGGGPGRPPVPDVDVDENGYVYGGCVFGVDCGAAIPVLSVEQCVANLRLSECEQPVSNLTDCAASLFTGGCGPTDVVCGDFLYLPEMGCSGTLIVPGSPGGSTPSCAVRVE